MDSQIRRHVGLKRNESTLLNIGKVFFNDKIRKICYNESIPDQEAKE